MKNIVMKKCIALIALLAIAGQSYALPNFIRRWETGFNYTIAMAKYTSNEVMKDASGKSYTKTITQNVTSKLGYGGYMGTYIPLFKLKKQKAIVALSVGSYYNYLFWDYDVPMFSGFTTDANGNIIDMSYTKAFGYSGMSVNTGVPVSLDVKFGGEASLQKAARWTGTFGVGAMPSMSATIDASNAGYGFGVSPFIKAEIGKKLGIFWKLRMQYSFGEIPFYKENTSEFKDITDYNASSSLIGKSMFSVSLIAMPFNFDWREDGWWNDFH